MAGEDHGLGGRVPLLEPATLDPAQKALYEQALQTIVPLGDKSGYETKTADGRLIGPFNSMLFSPAISKAFLAMQKAEGEHTSLSKRARQVVILSVGSVWQASYELYAHAGEGRVAGLDDASIEALKRGEPSHGLSDDERIAQQFTLAVVTERRVHENLFAAAQQAFDNKGVLDMIFLIACYQMVCSALKVFEVPVPPR